MKKGYSLVEFLVGLILSFLVLDLALGGFKHAKIDNHDHTTQDLISSLQIHQILNGSTDIIVSDQIIDFNYLNQQRTLEIINSKIIMKPGTVIYYLKVDNYNFYVEDQKIYLKVTRQNIERLFLIGLL